MSTRQGRVSALRKRWEELANGGAEKVDVLRDKKWNGKVKVAFVKESVDEKKSKVEDVKSSVNEDVKSNVNEDQVVGELNGVVEQVVEGNVDEKVVREQGEEEDGAEIVEKESLGNNLDTDVEKMDSENVELKRNSQDGIETISPNGTSNDCKGSDSCQDSEKSINGSENISEPKDAVEDSTNSVSLEDKVPEAEDFVNSFQKSKKKKQLEFEEIKKVVKVSEIRKRLEESALKSSKRKMRNGDVGKLVINDDSDSDEGSAKPYLPPSMIGEEERYIMTPFVKEIKRFKKSRQTINQIKSVVEVKIDDLDDSKSSLEYLVPSYQVTKFNTKQTFLSKRIRIWEINVLDREILSLNEKRKVTKRHRIDDLLLIERFSNPCKARLCMKNGQSYDLLFMDSAKCDSFYRCISALRSNSIVWAPDVCKDNESALIKIEGEAKFSLVEGGKKQDCESKGTVFLSAQKNPVEEIDIFVGTWNMGNRSPPPVEDFHKWIPPHKDIYAFSFQEADSKTDPSVYLRNVLGTEYFLVASSVLWAIRLVIFAKEKHINKISSLQISQKPTGFLNICGNKGGIAATFRFHESHLCFISSHLAAREENADLRNSHIYDISGQLQLGRTNLDISQFDFCFWFGDLNYRIDLPFKEGLQLALDGEIDQLMEVDQLKKLQDAGKIFSGWNEGVIEFLPTYKLEPGESELKYSDHKSRTPSYCDRILWKTFPNSSCELVDYDSVDSILTSDHIPVLALFRAKTILPFFDHFSPPSTIKYQIQFEDLFISGRTGRVINMPALTFHGLFIQGSPVKSTKAAKKQKIVNPEFNSLPTLYPMTHHISFLEQQHILIELRDDKKVKNRSGSKKQEPSFLGLGLLSLLEPCAQVNELITFKIAITAHTKFVGNLHGKVKLSQQE